MVFSAISFPFHDIFHHGDTAKQRWLRFTIAIFAAVDSPQIGRSDELKPFVKYVLGWSFSYFQFVLSFFWRENKIRGVRENRAAKTSSKKRDSMEDKEHFLRCGYFCLSECVCVAATYFMSGEPERRRVAINRRNGRHHKIDLQLIIMLRRNDASVRSLMMAAVLLFTMRCARSFVKT